MTENKLNGQNSDGMASLTDTYGDGLCGRIIELEDALRDALHQLETRNGWWVTDICPGPYEHTCRRDDTTEACKRIRKALSD